MRGYFGIGAEKIHKPMNIGSLFRTAHAFGADFMFTVDSVYTRRRGRLSDTSDAISHIPFYSFPTLTDMILPEGCVLVGVELTDDAIELPSFKHPRQAAYILGPEKGELSSEMLEKCVYTIKIPTKFCINVGLAGAIIMYDRIKTLGKFPRPPISSAGSVEPLHEHKYGSTLIRTQVEKFIDVPPRDGY